MNNNTYAPIKFAVDKNDNKLVVADRYVPHALYVQNKAIAEKLHGEILKGVGGFKAQFTNAKRAKEFINQAIVEMSENEYAATRKKTETKMRKSKKGLTPKPAKNQTEIKVKAETKSKAKKSKKGAETEMQKKVIDRLNVKLWNRVAAAYDRANGGSGAVTFANLNKTKAELKEFVPAGIASLKASKHWAKAIEANITEDMLG